MKFITFFSCSLLFLTTTDLFPTAKDQLEALVTADRPTLRYLLDLHQAIQDENNPYSEMEYQKLLNLYLNGSQEDLANKFEELHKIASENLIETDNEYASKLSKIQNYIKSRNLEELRRSIKQLKDLQKEFPKLSIEEQKIHLVALQDQHPEFQTISDALDFLNNETDMSTPTVLLDNYLEATYHPQAFFSNLKDQVSEKIKLTMNNLSKSKEQLKPRDKTINLKNNNEKSGTENEEDVFNRIKARTLRPEGPAKPIKTEDWYPTEIRKPSRPEKLNQFIQEKREAAREFFTNLSPFKKSNPNEPFGSIDR